MIDPDWNTNCQVSVSVSFNPSCNYWNVPWWTSARHTPSFPARQFVVRSGCKSPPQSRKTEELPWLTCILTTSVSDFRSSVGLQLQSCTAHRTLVTWSYRVYQRNTVLCDSFGWWQSGSSSCRPHLFSTCWTLTWPINHFSKPTAIHHLSDYFSPCLWSSTILTCFVSPCAAASFKSWPSFSRLIFPFLTGSFF